MQEIGSLFSLCPEKILSVRPDLKRYIAKGLVLTRNNRTPCKRDLV